MSNLYLINENNSVQRNWELALGDDGVADVEETEAMIKAAEKSGHVTRGAVSDAKDIFEKQKKNYAEVTTKDFHTMRSVMNTAYLCELSSADARVQEQCQRDFAAEQGTPQFKLSLMAVRNLEAATAIQTQLSAQRNRQGFWSNLFN